MTIGELNNLLHPDQCIKICEGGYAFPIVRQCSTYVTAFENCKIKSLCVSDDKTVEVRVETSPVYETHGINAQGVE